MNEVFTAILATTVRAATPLLFCAIGGILGERSGVIMLTLEGQLFAGTLAGFAVAFWTGNVWMGVVAAMTAGGVLALIHAVICVKLRWTQVLSGVGLTIFAIGTTSFLGERLGPGGKSLVGLMGPRFTKTEVLGLSNIPLLGQVVFNQDPLTYLAFLLVPLTWFLIFKTRPGRHLRAVGENPSAADTLGINVFRTRYVYTVLGGMLVGAGGAYLSLYYTPGWAKGMGAGTGWLAYALVLFASWNPSRLAFGAILFSATTILRFHLPEFFPQVSGHLVGALPYVLTIIVLTVSSSKKIGEPISLGTPYDRESRA